MKECGLEKNKTILIQFVESKNDEVRLWFATILLQLDETHAIKIIKEIIANDTLVSSNAEIVLDMWKTGDLDL